jgi:hypothetical protein
VSIVSVKNDVFLLEMTLGEILVFFVLGQGVLIELSKQFFGLHEFLFVS